MFARSAQIDLHQEVADLYARWRSGVMADHEIKALELWIAEGTARRQLWTDLSEAWVGIEPMEAELRAARPARRYAALIPIAASIVLMVCCAVLGVSWRQQRPWSPSIPTAAVFETPHGKRSTIMLADGSTMMLDAASRAVVRFAPGRRGISLERGRALFQVARDAQRPFVVTAAGRSVTALGTKFVVDVGTSRVEVDLVHGRVRVAGRAERSGRSTAKIITMDAGDRLIAPNTGGWVLSAGNAENMLAWTRGTLVFQDAPLDEIADQMNRYAHAPIIIADPATGQRRLSAVVTAGDTEAIAGGVRALGLADVRRRADGAIEMRALSAARIADLLEKQSIGS